MDTRTGLIHEMRDGEKLEDLAARLNARTEDLVEISKRPDHQCQKCKGKGFIKAGILSRRFKPCVCTL